MFMIVVVLKDLTWFQTQWMYTLKFLSKEFLWYVSFILSSFILMFSSLCATKQPQIMIVQPANFTDGIVFYGKNLIPFFLHTITTAFLANISIFVW